MDEAGVHLFNTAFGVAGLAWRGELIVAVSFPEGAESAAAARLKKHAPGAVEKTPPPAIGKICDEIAGLFKGAPSDFTGVGLDEESYPAFDREVWRLTRAIPAGKLKTYGELAKALGDVAFSRRVGQALGRNPFPLIVPCHRVVGAGGAMTGFSAAGGVDAKRRLLKIEGALAPDLFDLGANGSRNR